MSVAAGVAAGAAVVGAVSGLVGGSKAKKAAKRAAAREADIEQQVTTERLDRLALERRSLAGTTVARAAGSGVLIGSGSVLQILAEQAREFERERSITARVGASRASAAIASGRALGQQYQAQGLQSLFAGISQAAGIAYNAGLFSKKV